MSQVEFDIHDFPKLEQAIKEARSIIDRPTCTTSGFIKRDGFRSAQYIYSSGKFKMDESEYSLFVLKWSS